MTRPTYKLLQYFKANRYQPVSLDWLVRKAGKSRATVLGYLSQVRKHCPRGWRLHKSRKRNKILGGWDYFYTYCPSLESFRKQKTIFQEEVA